MTEKYIAVQVQLAFKKVEKAPGLFDAGCVFTLQKKKMSKDCQLKSNFQPIQIETG